MQAIVLAAGMGRRLGSLTKDNTKCMVEVNGEALIDRLLGQLSKLGLRRVVIVVGYKGKELIDHIGHRYDSRLSIEYVENPVYDKTNNIYSLALAKEKLQEDDTLLIESDLIFEDRMFDLILESKDPNVALVAKYETWMDGTMVRIDDDDNIVNFVPKKAFKYSDKDSYYKTCNIYKFSKDFSKTKYIPFLEVYMKALGYNEYYEQVLRIITFIDKSEVKALPITDEKWYEIDDIQDLDIARTIFSSGEDLWKNYSKRFGGFWRFPQMLDFNYLVNPFFPSDRMMDEMEANFRPLMTGYPSGMYVNSLLAGKYFGVRQEYIVPGNGASELIKSLMALLPGRVGVVYPTFEEYPNRKPEDLVIFNPSGADFHYTADELMIFFGKSPVSSLLLINPDNPSGNYLDPEDVRKIASWCSERRIRLIVDESFADFASDYGSNTLMANDILEKYPTMAVIKSISKSFGVPGLRLGVLASADKDLISMVKKDISIWNINSFAEFYMQIFGKYESDYQRACEKFQKERDRFFTELNRIPYLRVIPSQANFFLCEVIGKYTATGLAITLIKRNNILVKDCSYKMAFEGKQYVRIAVRGGTDNDKLLEALKAIS